MGFWEKIGEAQDSVMGSIGDVWTSAWNNEVGSALISASPLGFITTRSTDMVDPNKLTPQARARWEARRALEQKINKPVDWVLSAANRGISAATQASVTSEGPDNLVEGFFSLPFGIDDFKEAWKRTGPEVTTTDTGQPAEGISAGQAVVSKFSHWGDFDRDRVYAMDQKSVDERRKFFKETWRGRLSSGAIDIAVALYADPMEGAGKLAKMRRGAVTNVAAEDVTGAVAGARGLAAKESPTPQDLSKSQVAAGRRIKALADATEGRNTGEIAMLPWFNSKLSGEVATDTSAYAALLSDANRIVDPEERLNAKIDIIATGLGDLKAKERLQERHADLHEQLQLMGDMPPQTVGYQYFTVEDGGAKMFDFYHDRKFEQEWLEKRKAIETEIARLDSVIASSGFTSKIDATAADLAAARARNQGLYDDWLTAKTVEKWTLGGLGTRATRVVHGLAGNKLPGHVQIKSPDAGLADVRNYVSRMKYTAPKTRRDMLSQYAAATNDGQRAAVIQRIEGQMHSDVARAFGITDSEDASKILQACIARRKSVMDRLKTRLYSMTEVENAVPFLDGETGILHGFSKPLLQSQIADHVAIMDPDLTEWMYKVGTRSRVLDRFLNPDTLDKIGEANKTVISGMQSLTRIWKDSALMLRPGYIGRVQMDSQLRIMAHLGMLQWMANIPTSMKAMKYYTLSREGAEGLSWKNMFRTGDMQGAYKKILSIPRTEKIRLPNGKYVEVDMRAARNDNEVEFLSYVLSQQPGGSALSELGDAVSSSMLKNLRSTGNWAPIRPGDPSWWANYERAVRQIRYSPTAMRALINDDLVELRKFVTESRAGRAEWANLAPSHPEGIDHWLSQIIAHNKQYLPKRELKDWVSRIERADVEPMAMEKLYAIDVAKTVTLEATDKRMASLREAEQRAEAARMKADKAKQLYLSMKAKADAIKAVPARSRSAKQKADLIEAEKIRRRARKNWTDYRNESLRRSNVVIQARKDAKTFEKRARGQQEVQAELVAPEGAWTRQMVKDYFTDVRNRMEIHGEVYSPFTQSRVGEWWTGVRNGWYKFAADAPEDILARSPLYATEFRANLKRMVSRHQGDLTVDDIDNYRRVASKQARKTLGNILYDSADMSQLGYHMRLVSPFFGAWEDSMKKWANLFYEDPSTAVRMYHTLSSLEAERTYIGEDGQTRMTVLPISLGRPLGGAKLAIRPDSFNVIFQGDPWWAPSAGPLVQVPVNNFVRSALPELAEEPAFKSILGIGVTKDEGAMQVAPAWAKNFVKAFPSAFGTSQEFANTFSMLAAQDAIEARQQGRKPKSYDEINKATRNWFILKAVSRQVSPVTIDPSPKFQFYIDQYHRMNNEFQKDPEAYRKAHNKNDARQQFWEEFPEYAELTISLSKNESGLVASEKVMPAIRKYRQDMAKDLKYAWVLAGAENYGEFSQGVYAFQTTQEVGYGNAMKFRSQKSPAEAMKQFEAERGWQAYQKMNLLIDEELARRGLKSIRSRGAEDILEAKKQQIRYLGQKYGGWAEAYDADSGEGVVRMVNAALSAQDAHPELRKRSDMRKLNSYLVAREQMRQAMAANGSMNIDNKVNQNLASAWATWVKQMADSDLGFRQMYDRVLERDDLSRELIGVG
jgi:hypothetical protein